MKPHSEDVPIYKNATTFVFVALSFRMHQGMHLIHGMDVVWERGGEVTLGQQHHA